MHDPQFHAYTQTVYFFLQLLELQWLTATLLSNAACWNIALAGVNFLLGEVRRAGGISAEERQGLACMSGPGDAP